MSDLVEFLRGRLAHDEAHAKKDIWCADEATPGRWQTRYGVNLSSSWVETDASPVAKLDASGHQADAMLIGRFKPDTVRARAQRMLADVDAKRALLDAMIGPALSTAVANTCDAGLATARFLALPYRDHPDYRPEWAPE